MEDLNIWLRNIDHYLTFGSATELDYSPFTTMEPDLRR